MAGGKASQQARKTSRHAASQALAAGKDTGNWKTPAKEAFHKRKSQGGPNGVDTADAADDAAHADAASSYSKKGKGYGAGANSNTEQRPLKKQRTDSSHTKSKSNKSSVGASRMKQNQSGAVTNASANAFSVDEVVHKAKLMWEQVRERKMTKEQRTERVDKLFAHCRGKFFAISRRHDSSRILQTLLKHGSEAQRHIIATELMPGVVDLAMQHYSKHLIQKLYRVSSLADRRLILDAMLPKIKRLLRHKESCVVVDFIFNMHATAPERAEMLGQFYGPDYLLALQRWLEEHPEATSVTRAQRPSNDPRHQSKLQGQIRPPTLSEVVQGDDAVHARTLRFMTDQISRATDKGVPVIRQSLVQTLLDDWYQIASFSSAAEMTASIREQLVEMVHTRNGSRACIAAAFSGNSKDRKIIVKSLKGYVVDIAKQEHAYRFLLAVLAVTDDTKLTRTAIVSELIKDIGDLCCDRWAVRIILWILSPGHRKFLTSQDAEDLTSDSRDWWRAPRSAVSAAAADEEMLDAGEASAAAPASDTPPAGSVESKSVFKKPVDVKLTELRPPVQSAIEAFLLESHDNVQKLLCDQFGSEVLIEALRASDSSDFVKSVGSSLSALCRTGSDAIAAAESEDTTDRTPDVLSGMFSSRALKALIKQRPGTLGLSIASNLAGQLCALACTQGACFVVLALAEMAVSEDSKAEEQDLSVDVAAATTAVRDELLAGRAEIAVAAKKGLAGAKLILALLN